MAVPRWRRELTMAEIVELQEGKRGFLFQQSFPLLKRDTTYCVDALCEAVRWAVLTVLALNSDQRHENRGPGIWRSWLPQFRCQGPSQKPRLVRRQPVFKHTEGYE
jgi:hypothetical protein